MADALLEKLLSEEGLVVDGVTLRLGGATDARLSVDGHPAHTLLIKRALKETCLAVSEVDTYAVLACSDLEVTHMVTEVKGTHKGEEVVVKAWAARWSPGGEECGDLPDKLGSGFKIKSGAKGETLAFQTLVELEETGKKVLECAEMANDETLFGAEVEYRVVVGKKRKAEAELRSGGGCVAYQAWLRRAGCSRAPRCPARSRCSRRARRTCGGGTAWRSGHPAARARHQPRRAASSGERSRRAGVAGLAQRLLPPSGVASHPVDKTGGEGAE